MFTILHDAQGKPDPAFPNNIPSFPRGIDVFNGTGPIDWHAVAHSGIKFAYIKTSEGLTFRDARFPDNWAGAKREGLLRGAYHYFHPNMDPIEQADWFLLLCGHSFAPGDLHPAIDVEVSDGRSPSQVITAVGAFTKRIFMKTGRDTVIYTYPYFWQHNAGDTAAFSKTNPLWIANWGVQKPRVVGGWPYYTFWQYTDAGRVPGIRREVDGNVFNGPLDQLRKFAML